MRWRFSNFYKLHIIARWPTLYISKEYWLVRLFVCVKWSDVPILSPYRIRRGLSGVPTDIRPRWAASTPKWSGACIASIMHGSATMATARRVSRPPKYARYVTSRSKMVVKSALAAFPVPSIINDCRLFFTSAMHLLVSDAIPSHLFASCICMTSIYQKTARSQKNNANKYHLLIQGVIYFLRRMYVQTVFVFQVTLVFTIIIYAADDLLHANVFSCLVCRFNLINIWNFISPLMVEFHRTERPLVKWNKLPV
jgi:hypothetical protein